MYLSKYINQSSCRHAVLKLRHTQNSTVRSPQSPTDTLNKPLREAFDFKTFSLQSRKLSSKRSCIFVHVVPIIKIMQYELLFRTENKIVYHLQSTVVLHFIILHSSITKSQSQNAVCLAVKEYPRFPDTHQAFHECKQRLNKAEIRNLCFTPATT